MTVYNANSTIISYSENSTAPMLTHSEAANVQGIKKQGINRFEFVACRMFCYANGAEQLRQSALRVG